MKALAAAVLAALVAAPPPVIIIVTPRGERLVPITTERGVPALAAPLLAEPLDLTILVDHERALVTLGGQGFILDLTAPFVRLGDSVYPLLAPPYVARDTLFLPLQWLVEIVPRALGTRYRWVPAAARFIESTDSLATATGATTSSPPAAANALTGLRRTYTIVVDPGHGGPDPGNPGIYLPNGKTEKDVVLTISRLLRAELLSRGLAVRMTRSTDTLIDLSDRGAACRTGCDLFVSVHLNSMPAGRRQHEPNGVETYFLSDARTEDQRRVARMENDAIRFQTSTSLDAGGPIPFILRDLQLNEYLRESARLATEVQSKIAAIHPGKDRGVQQSGLVVLTTAGRPAILVEAGFTTNRGDGAFLGSALGQRKIANAIADGIVAYLQDYERKVTAAPTGGPGR